MSTYHYHKFVQGAKGLIEYRNPITNHYWDYHFPPELAVKLTNYIKSGDICGMSRLLDHIIEANFTSRQIKIEASQLLLMELMSTTLKTLHDLTLDEPFLCEINLEDLGAGKVSAIEMINDMKQWLLQICESVSLAKSDRGEELYLTIIQFIEENFENGNLSLIVIAEQVGITPQYLSFFFKKYSEINLHDYITNLRMGRAKKLLAAS